jgi:FixJ family two-component response regulator
MADERSPVVAVVDDDPDVRVALMRLIEAAGYVAESFASGAELVDALGRKVCTPGCIVLDLQMPGLSGFDVQQQLAAAHPEVQVVVITGRDTRDARTRAISFGAKAYLSKPVDGDVLLEIIGEVLRH